MAAVRSVVTFNQMSEAPLVAITGPTASGKTTLAVDLARQFKGEIICADSRTVYKNMDVGTAKPSHEERSIVPHWGLDLVEPGQQFTVADFKHYAEQKIQEIRKRGHVPFLVGGTGLYIDAVLFNYQFSLKADPIVRQQLESLTVNELQEYCNKRDIKLPENKMNKRYLIRTIERKGVTGERRRMPISNAIIVGIATDKITLYDRIKQRSEHLFDAGVVEEAIKLGKKYGWESEAMTGNIYPLVHKYLDDVLTLDEVKQQFVTLDWRLAKRQLTWLRRNNFIQWLHLSDARSYLSSVLSEY